jgi:hypothetical protein
MCCEIEVSAMGQSLVQRSPIKFGVSECDLETSTMRLPWPTGTVKPFKKGTKALLITVIKVFPLKNI